MTPGLSCYFLLSNLPPERKIWSSVAFVHRWLFAPKSFSLCAGQYHVSQLSLPSSRTACSRKSITLHYCFPWENSVTRRHAAFLLSADISASTKSGHSGPNPRGLACNANRKCLTAWSISLGCSPHRHHQRLEGNWVQPEVREVPGMVPVAIFSQKVQKFTCLDLLVQSSRRGRGCQGEAGKSQPDTGRMTGGQGRVRATS